MKSIKDVQLGAEKFVNDREWQPFQSPKNLVMALTGEVGELVEHFQWLTQAESAALSDDQKQEVQDEMADVFIYLVRLADMLDVDLLTAAEQKMLKNTIKYPIATSKDSLTKEPLKKS